MNEKKVNTTSSPGLFPGVILRDVLNFLPKNLIENGLMGENSHRKKMQFNKEVN